MNAIIKGKVFKSGNSAAVRLPKELGFEPGTDILLERTGRGITIKPASDPDEAQRRNRALADAILAIWADAPDREVEVLDRDIFPDRPGLY